MQYIGLLTDEQKRAGYFVAQDEDFVYLFLGRNGDAKIIGIWNYETVRIKDIRDRATEDT